MMEFNEQTIGETTAYKSFAAKFDENIEFIKNLADLGTFNGRMISFFADGKLHIVDNFLIDSAARTLQSIKLTCSIGAISDANTLVRKLRDDLLLYIYLLDIAKKGTAFNEDLSLKTTLTNDQKAAVAWLTGTVDLLPWSIKKKLGFENYMDYLKGDSYIHDTLVQHNLTAYWKNFVEG